MKVSRNRPLVLFVVSMGIAMLVGSLHFLGGGLTGKVSLVILTPHGDNIRQEIGAAFQAWHLTRFETTPEIEWVDQGGTSEGLRYVQSKFARSPTSIGIDIFFGGGTPPFRALARDGFLVPEAITLPAGLPMHLGGIKLQAPEEGWYGTALSSFGILSNLELLKQKGLPKPASWTDLARPEAYGWVACIDPRGSGSAHVIYEIVLQKFGWEAGWRILAGIAANSRVFTKGASGVLPIISTGEAAYTVAIDQYAWSLIASAGAGAGTAGSDRIGFLLPIGETVITPDPAAMLKGAPNAAIARRFLEFLLSAEGQRLWILRPGVPGGPASLALNRMAVLPEAYAHMDPATSAVGSNPFLAADSAGPEGAFTYSDSLTEIRWSLVSDALGLWMVDNHDGAKAAWENLIAARPKTDDGSLEAWEVEVAANPFFRPPAPWSEIEAMTPRWKDQDFRNSTMARWARMLND